MPDLTNATCTLSLVLYGSIQTVYGNQGESMSDKLLFIKDVADRLGRSPAQVSWMVHKGTAPKSAIIAGRRMFKESDVEAFIDAAFEQAG